MGRKLPHKNQGQFKFRLRNCSGKSDLPDTISAHTSVAGPDADSDVANTESMISGKRADVANASLGFSVMPELRVEAA